MEQKPKKRRIGLVILIVFLSLLIIIPVGAYAFLSLTQFGGGGISLNEDIADAPFAGSSVLSADGSVSALLTEEDIYWIAAKNNINDIYKLIPKDIDLLWWRVATGKNSLSVFANGKAYGFIPLSVKVELELAASADARVITVTPKTVMIGTKLKLKAENFYAFGLAPSYTVYTQSMGFSDRLSAISFTDEGISVSEKLPKEPFERMMALARANANETYIFADVTLAEGNQLYPLAARYGDEPILGDEIFACAASQEDHNKAFCGLAALCSAEDAELEMSVFNEFERHFFLNWTDENESAMREGYKEARVQGQRDYETLLTALREKYKAMELTLDTRYILDNATNERVKLNSLPCGEKVNDETSLIMLLNSFEPTHAVMTDDMPALDKVPATSVKVYRGEYYMRPYDLGILLVLPTGEPALIYYQQNGRFTVHMVSDIFYEERMQSELLPFATTDVVPNSVRSAPENDLSDYEIIRQGQS